MKTDLREIPRRTNLVRKPKTCRNSRKFRPLLAPMHFGQLLEKRLEALGMSHTAFARKVGVKSPYIHSVRAGRRPVPEDRVESWADALELTGKARVIFIEEALLTRCPQAIRERFRQLKDEIALLRSK